MNASAYISTMTTRPNSASRLSRNLVKTSLPRVVDLPGSGAASTGLPEAAPAVPALSPSLRITVTSSPCLDADSGVQRPVAARAQPSGEEHADRHEQRHGRGHVGVLRGDAGDQPVAHAEPAE